jgi:hypothetical protein
MENIFPLILIIVVFNVINAILKALKGGKGAAQKALPTAYTKPERQVKINLWDDDSFEEIPLESDYETSEAETESFAAPMSTPPLPETLNRRHLEQKAESERIKRVTNEGNTGYGDPGCSVSPANVFASGDAFLSAYIFHEILQPPVSMRKKR